MTKNRVFALFAALVIGLVVLGATAHATAGASHEPDACLTCSLCLWLHSVLS
jgi:hypothetical protein